MKSFAKLKSGFDGRRPCDHRKGVMHARLSTLRRLLFEINRGQAKALDLSCMSGIRISLVIASDVFPRFSELRSIMNGSPN